MSCALRKHSYSGMSSCSQSLLFCLHWSVFKATRGLKNNPMHSPHTICGFTPKGCVMSCCFSAINKQCCVNLCTLADMLLIIVEWSGFPCWLLQLFHCTVVKEVFSLFNFIIFFMFFRTHHHHVKETGQRATSRALSRGTEYFFICALKESFKQEKKNCHC